MSDVITMTLEEWDEKFIPIKNPLDGRASMDGAMFETFGEEIGFVMGVATVAPDKVWTYVDGDRGTYIIDGYHFVNRIGHFITQNPRDPDCCYEIIVSQDEPKEEDV